MDTAIAPSRPAPTTAGAIDCDVHIDAPRRADLLPFLDAYWRDTVATRDIDRLDLTSSPPGAKPFRRPDWNAGTGVARLRDQLLDPFGLRYAIGHCVFGAQAVYDPYLAAALCRATNDWLVAEWLDREPRLRASMTVSLRDPARAVEEIERLAPDRRFVQIVVLAMDEMPLGRSHNWPVLDAAARHGLPVAVHAGSSYRHAPTQSGFPSYLIEDVTGQTQGFAAQVVSLIAEGAFARFPDLKVVLAESGVTWLPSLMWRMSKDWRGVRHEVPWVSRSPAELVRDHVRLTLAPFDAPPDSGDIAGILDHLGSDDMLLFSTDYPHWHFDGDAALPPGLPDHLVGKILVDNAIATYPRLGISPQGTAS